MQSTQMDAKEYSYFADNQWRKAGDNQFFEVQEPYSGKLFARVAAGSRADARIAVDAAANGFAEWASTTPAERARLFLKAAEIVKRRRSEIAEVLARETGSTISFFQQHLVAATLQQVAGWVFLPKGEVLETSLSGTHSIGVRRPLGVVASFTPWNGANVLSWRAVISGGYTGRRDCRRKSHDVRTHVFDSRREYLQGIRDGAEGSRRHREREFTDRQR